METVLDRYWLPTGGGTSHGTSDWTSLKSCSNTKMTNKKYWSGEVTKKSIALDLEEGVFTWKDPRKIAASLKKSAEDSTRRKGTPFQSAMSMLNFYINRAGKN